MLRKLGPATTLRSKECRLPCRALRDRSKARRPVESAAAACRFEGSQTLEAAFDLNDIRPIFTLGASDSRAGAFDDHHRARNNRGRNGEYHESDDGLQSSSAETPE